MSESTFSHVAAKIQPNVDRANVIVHLSVESADCSLGQ